MNLISKIFSPLLYQHQTKNGENFITILYINGIHQNSSPNFIPIHKDLGK